MKQRFQQTIAHTPVRMAYRRYRAAKQYCISRPDSVIARSFFRLLCGAERLFALRESLVDTSKSDSAWKRTYTEQWGSEPVVQLQTAKAVAVDSDDHTWPRGSLRDNSINRQFNQKLYEFCQANHQAKSELRVLDLGCAGGGFIRSIVEDGYLGIGIEGSDISQRLRRGEWSNIPNHLFTGDITSPFSVLGADQSLVLFNCITAWEVLEHIPQELVPALLSNVRRHLAPGGIFVASVDQSPDGNPITGAVYHVTLKSKSWWLQQFQDAGFAELEQSPFETQDFVRGHGMGWKDWDPRDGEGFHLVMRLKKQLAQARAA